MTPATVRLDRRMFADSAFTVVEHGPLRVELFRYSSGVPALRVVTDVGQAAVLPFDGQRIWDADFHGRTLTMESTFDEPLAGVDYLGGNGAYFIHCGGSAMGNPGATDEHPLHGELPAAALDDVTLRLHLTDGTPSVTLTGGMVHRRSFGAFFEAQVALTIRAGSGVMRSTVRLTNRSREPRPLMYLAHINMRPAVDGRIVGGATVAPLYSDVRITRAGETAHLRAGDDVDVNQLLGEGTRVEPELVQRHEPTGATGSWVQTRQIHADGSSDIVAYRSAHLRHVVRWLRRSADDAAFGFALPASAGPNGFLAESAEGRVELFEPGESLTAVIDHGIVPPGETHRPSDPSDPTDR